MGSPLCHTLKKNSLCRLSPGLLTHSYHNSFDLKGEREDGMLYSQVKWYTSGSISGGHIADAKRTIDRNYPYYFPYQKIQIWMVWKEWVKRPGERRHKEFFFRVWQRGEPIEHNKDGYHFFEWPWKEITDEVRKEYESYHTPIKSTSEVISECNITSEVKEQPRKMQLKRILLRSLIVQNCNRLLSWLSVPIGISLRITQKKPAPF